MERNRSYIATPPGATIKEQLDDRGMSRKEFAARMDMPEKRISELMDGDVPLTPEIAARLEMVLGVPAQFWSNLEKIYEEKKVKLTKITRDDLLFPEGCGYDGTCTFLTLNDYDWMDYSLKTQFQTHKLGILDVNFRFFGTVTSVMEVEQTLNGKTKKATYKYPTEIFQKYIIKFLEEHIASWDGQYAFDGGDIVIEFFNAVIENTQNAAIADEDP